MNRLRHGALAGAAAGACLALFLRLVGEPTIAKAIAMEAERGPASDELFSRGAQQAGGVVGAVAYGVCLGVVAAAVLASVARRSSVREEWRRGMAVGAAGFLTVALLPFLKYPANPPGVGDPETIGRRTLLFVAMLGVSVLASWGAWRLWTALRDRGWPEHSRLAATAVAYAGVVGAAFVLLPGSGDAVDAPASLVWRFRLSSLGGSAVYWVVLGWTLGYLSRRDQLGGTGLHPG
ncbi:MAG: CbtA family protein [Actinomycetota bacterium]|nr:CbtA family protein [Actinomycetota bacterium]